MSEKTTLVLLHGAGVGAWVWEPVQQMLTAPAWALNVPGRHAGATPDGCAAALVADMDRRGLQSVVLVVHSLAGVLVPGLAARLGPRLVHCVYVGAVVPPSGGAFVDALGLANRVVLRLLFKFNRKGLKPSPAMIRRELCNDLDEATAQEVVSRYEAEFAGLYLSPTGPRPAVGAATYVKLLKDQSVVPAQQDASIARLHHPTVREIDAGHLAMLSAPKQLAALLDQVALAPTATRAQR